MVLNVFAVVGGAALAGFILQIWTPGSARLSTLEYSVLVVSCVGLIWGLLALGLLESQLIVLFCLTVSITSALYAAWVDLRIKMSPDIAPALIGVSALAGALWDQMLLRAVIASGLATLILFVASRIIRPPAGRKTALGSGDIVMVATLGLWVSPQFVPYALLIAVASTLLLYGLLIYLDKQKSKPLLIPFIPGLCLGFMGLAVIGPVLS